MAQFDKVRVVRVATVLLLAVMLGFWGVSLAQSAWSDVVMSPLACLPAVLLWFRVETGRL
ncbi:hypothetical protein [Nocardioides sp.]|uniref:hypothetical protein n=1 Tax=Nocardioides sp. TaxID=35761 RepID=UPI00356260FD